MIKWNGIKKRAMLGNNHKVLQFSPAETRSHRLLLIANVVSLLLRAHPWLSISQPQISANIKHQDRRGGGSSPNHCSILRTKMSSHRETTRAKQPPDSSPHWKETNERKKPFHPFTGPVCFLESQAMFHWAPSSTVSKQKGWSEEWKLQTA